MVSSVLVIDRETEMLVLVGVRADSDGTRATSLFGEALTSRKLPERRRELSPSSEAPVSLLKEDRRGPAVMSLSTGAR